MLFWTILVYFWCPVVTKVTFSSKLSSCFKNLKKKNQKCQNPKKSQKYEKIPKKIPKNHLKKKLKNHFFFLFQKCQKIQKSEKVLKN